jgi:hypothetical protein
MRVINKIQDLIFFEGNQKYKTEVFIKLIREELLN